MTSPSRSTRSRRPGKPPTPGPEAPAAEEAPTRSPIFLPPEDLPAPAPTMAPEPPPLLAEPLPSSSPLPSLPDAGHGSESPSDTRSTPPDSSPAKAPKLTRAGLRKFARRAVEMAGVGLAAWLTAAQSIEREERLWVPDDEDVEAIAEPIAGLAARRLPDKLGGAAANPDVEDGLALVVALGEYLGKQWGKHLKIAAERARMVLPDDPNPESVVTA